jgi:hypothetical protein
MATVANDTDDNFVKPEVLASNQEPEKEKRVNPPLDVE